MAELANILTGDAEPQAAKITTEMLDYDYVRKCNSVEDMKGIVQVLQSGREGHYPELQKLAEEKLLSMLPENEKKKYMRLHSVPTPAEISEAEQDIQKWEAKISNMDSVLKSMSSSEIPSSTKKRMVPGVRGTSSTPSTVSENVPANTSGRTSTTHSTATQGNLDQKGDNTKQKRLSGYDFRAWEKFDADAAAGEVEKLEEEIVKRAEANHHRHREQRDEEAKKRLMIHHAEMKKLSESIQASSLTQAERLLRASTLLFYIHIFHICSA
jgi:sperm-associated antigen 1